MTVGSRRLPHSVVEAISADPERGSRLAEIPHRHLPSRASISGPQRKRLNQDKPRGITVPHQLGGTKSGLPAGQTAHANPVDPGAMAAGVENADVKWNCPAGPAGPAGPVAPTVAPISPCGPASPVSPFGPCGPAAPVAPVAPVSPFGPCGPALRSRQSHLSHLSHHADPSQSGRLTSGISRSCPAVEASLPSPSSTRESRRSCQSWPQRCPLPNRRAEQRRGRPAPAIRPQRPLTNWPS